MPLIGRGRDGAKLVLGMYLFTLLGASVWLVILVLRYVTGHDTMWKELVACCISTWRQGAVPKVPPASTNTTF